MIDALAVTESLVPPKKPLTMTIKVDADDCDGLLRALEEIDYVLRERPDNPAPRDYTAGSGWHLSVRENPDGLTGEPYYAALKAWMVAYQDAKQTTDRSRQSAVPGDDEPATSGSQRSSTETPVTEGPV